MRDDAATPTGLARRRRRLSDKDTEQRMLEAALAMVRRAGLTVSLEHISLEDVIRDAGVSRSAVYRRWPHKDLFFSDLLRELAEAPPPTTIAEDKALEAVQRVILDHLDWFRTPERHHDLCVEVFRLAALRDFDHLYGSTEWRTYIALHATFLSLPHGDLRDEVQRALTGAERELIGRVAKTYQDLAGLLGYRLRPELNANFETLASLVSAMARGQVIMAPSNPEIASQRIQARPFGAAETREWSHPALGTASIAFSFLERDPTITWDDERIAAVGEAVRHLE